MNARKLLILSLAVALSGCAAGSSKPMRMATASYCPAGTVLVCTGLYEPERELAPSCACTDLQSRR